MIPDSDALAREMRDAVHKFESDRDRQSVEGRLGISDIGFCRQYAAYVVKQQPATDDPPKWAAFVGTAVGDRVEYVVQHMFPIARRHLAVEVELPSGLKLPGHPDIVTPSGVIDIKTVDGLEVVKFTGASVQQQFQKHLYAAALIQSGDLDEETAWVANAWFDRSGRQPEPHVEIEAYDPMWLFWADEWLSDVTYAVRHNEDAAQDKPIQFCEVACPFFTVCRADDVVKDREGGGLLVAPEHVQALSLYVEARKDKKAAERAMEDAQRALAGVSGVAEGHVLRWTSVGESDVPGYTRRGYTRMDVRKLPKPVERRKK